MIGARKVYRELIFTVVRSLVVGLMAGCAALLNTAAAETLIATEQGFVRGSETQSVDKFLGIPYAAPPVGVLRWKPPQPHASWSGVLNATKFGSHCAQTARVVGISSSSEDCLFLNVYVPNDADNEQAQMGDPAAQGNADLRGRAVMVWIHGGDLTAGESDDFDASRLASRRRDRCHDQLSPGCTRIPGASGTDGGIAQSRLWKLRHSGSAIRTQMGAAEYSRIRRRPGQCHRLRSICRRPERARQHGLSRRSGAVPQGDRAKRRIRISVAYPCRWRISGHNICRQCRVQ
jgi:hypothetical protein